jgi:hypothetical protein
LSPRHFLLTLACSLVAATGLGACGSDDGDNATTTQGSTSTTSSSIADFKGVYTATLKNPELADAAGPRAHWPTGLWRMAFGTREPNIVTLSPGDFELSVADLTDRRITFAPDRTCDTKKGQTKNSVFAIVKSSTGVRFTAITPSCRSDAAVLTLGDWRGPAG